MYSYEATLRNAIGRRVKNGRPLKQAQKALTAARPSTRCSRPIPKASRLSVGTRLTPNYRSSEFRLAQEYNPADPLERLLYNWSKDLYSPYGKPDMFIPPLVFTSEQSQRGELNTALKTQVDRKSYAAFVTGQADIESGWESYLTELQNLSLQDFLDIYQSAYDAKYAN